MRKSPLLCILCLLASVLTSEARPAIVVVGRRPPPPFGLTRGEAFAAGAILGAVIAPRRAPVIVVPPPRRPAVIIVPRRR